MKIEKLSLIAAATFLSVLSVPGSSSAQIVGTPIGEWSGVYSFQTTVYDFGKPTEHYSGGGRGYLVLSYTGFPDWEMTITPNFISVGGRLSPPDPFGPTSASGSLLAFGGPGGSSYGDFSVTYESILPNGQLDVGDGSAIADLTRIFYINELESITYATFTTVPEPTSIVHAALAVIVIAVVASIRAFRKRLCARQTSATWRSMDS